MSEFNIKKEREKLGLTQSELAKKIGVSLRTVQNYENGEVIPKSKYEILRNVFGANNTNWLLTSKVVTLKNDYIIKTYKECLGMATDLSSTKEDSSIFENRFNKFVVKCDELSHSLGGKKIPENIPSDKDSLYAIIDSRLRGLKKIILEETSIKEEDLLDRRTLELRKKIKDKTEQQENLPSVNSKDVPYYDLPVSAGELGVLYNRESYKPAGYINIEAFNGCVAAFPIIGISMEPLIYKGDIIGVQEIDLNTKTWEYIQTGVIYLIITHEDRMIKYLNNASENDHIVCSSPNYQAFKVHKADIIEIYRVKAIVRPL
jgi:transcriptional regulator with XRE-family HTH domain